MEGYKATDTINYNDINSRSFRFYVKNSIPGSTAYLIISCNSVNSPNDSSEVTYQESQDWNRSINFGNKSTPQWLWLFKSSSHLQNTSSEGGFASL